MACPTKVLAIACYSTRASEKANWASPYIPEESGPSGLGAIKPDRALQQRRLRRGSLGGLCGISCAVNLVDSSKLSSEWDRPSLIWT
jgi:hypothetical protein